VLEQAGVPYVFILAAMLAAAAAVGLSMSQVHLTRARPAARLVPSATRSMTLILRNRLVTLIALVVIAGEVFGFSSITLFPTFARNVLDVDAVGLGAMSAARSVGGIAGLLLLATVGFRERGGRLLLLAAIGFGLALVAFSASTIFLLSLVLLLVVGVMSAALDTLGQSLVQHSVGDHERGAAMGVWFFSIGVGPVGGLALGGAAEAIGAPLALAISGSILALVGAALSSVRALRQLA
jgi:MFS family permease